MILVGLNGPALSGKDTAFTAIESWAAERGVLAVRGAFADKLKWSAARLFWPECTLEEGVGAMDAWKQNAIEGRAQRGSYAGFGIEYLMLGVPSHNAGSMFSPEPTEARIREQMDGRTFLQRYGTESHRDVFDYDFWVDALLPKPTQPGDESGNDGFYQKHFPGAGIIVITDCRFENEARRILDLRGQIWTIDRPGMGGIDAHISELKLPTEMTTLTIFNESGVEHYAQTVKRACDMQIKLEETK